MKKNPIVYATLVLLLASCARQRQSCNASTVQNVKRDYKVIMYSGGDTVFYDEFHGIINNNHESDGVYYLKGDTLVEVSGDYVIISEK